MPDANPQPTAKSEAEVNRHVQILYRPAHRCNGHSIITVIIGIVAMLRLPIAQFPDLAPPEILLQATYVGADALTLEQSVATPIEQQLQGVDNMIYMTSINSSSGLMRLRVDFDVGTDPNTDQILTQMRYPRPRRSFRSTYATTVSRSSSRSPARWRCSRSIRPREPTTPLSSRTTRTSTSTIR